MNKAAKVAAWIVGAPVVLTLGFCLKIVSDPDAKHRMAAREACETTIKTLSANPSNVSIDIVHPHLEGNLLVSRWTPDQLQIQNQYGAMIGHAVVCGFDPKTQKIEQFTVN